jgi:hypothetical protein
VNYAKRYGETIQKGRTAANIQKTNKQVQEVKNAR